MRPSPDEGSEESAYSSAKDGVFVTPKKRKACLGHGLGLGIEGKNTFEFCTWRSQSHVSQAPKDIS